MSDGPASAEPGQLGVVAFRNAWSMDERHCPVVRPYAAASVTSATSSSSHPCPTRPMPIRSTNASPNCPRSQTINAGLFDGGLDARRPEQVWCEPLAGSKSGS